MTRVRDAVHAVQFAWMALQMQLHSARELHIESSDPIEAMEGRPLHTYVPQPRREQTKLRSDNEWPR